MTRNRRVRDYWLFHSFQGMLGAALAGLVVVVTLFGGLLAPKDPSAVDLNRVLQGPSRMHPFGTDDVGRDVLSRVLVGARYTMPAALTVVVVSFLIGAIVGVAAGYFGGWSSNVLMRVTDLFLSFPALLLAIAIAAALGTGLVQTVIALSVVIWASYARLAYAQTITIRHRPFMDAAEMSGSSTMHKLTRHVLPNSVSSIVVKATMDIALCVEWIASLGFVGLGAQQPTPEWGAMIATSRGYILTGWWFVLFPCLAIIIAVVGFNMLGAALDAHLFGRTGSLSGRAIRQLNADDKILDPISRGTPSAAA